jgi:hypothetical protein
MIPKSYGISGIAISAKPTRGFPSKESFCKKKSIGLIVFFFFQKKKQKALFRFAEGYISPIISSKQVQSVWGFPPRNVSTKKSIGLIIFFFFQKKKQKALFRFAEGYISPIISSKQVQSVWGFPLRNVSIKKSVGVIVSSFSRKRSKKRCSASQKVLFAHNILKADSECLGLSPKCI